MPRPEISLPIRHCMLCHSEGASAISADFILTSFGIRLGYLICPLERNCTSVGIPNEKQNYGGCGCQNGGDCGYACYEGLPFGNLYELLFLVFFLFY